MPHHRRPAQHTDQVARGTYNLASSSLLTVLALAEMVAEVTLELTGRLPGLATPNGRAAAGPPCRVSTDELDHLGVRAGRSVRSGVEDTMRFCLGNLEAIR